jgi:hypothetical protein
MRYIKVIGLAFVAAFALNALTAINASALPWFSLPLGFALFSPISGETFSDKDANKTGSATLWTGSGVTVECKSNKGTGNIKGGTPGTDEEKITYSACSVVGKTETECSVKSKEEPANTVASELDMEFVYIGTKGAAEAQKPPVGALFKPKTGEAYVTMIFEGTSCPVKGEQIMKGTAVAELLPEATLGESGEIGHTSKAITFMFPTKAIVIAYPGGTKTVEFSKKPGLTFLSTKAVQSGEELLELEDGSEIGVVSL